MYSFVLSDRAFFPTRRHGIFALFKENLEYLYKRYRSSRNLLLTFCKRQPLNILLWLTLDDFTLANALLWLKLDDFI